MFLMCKITKSSEIVTFLKCQVWNNPETPLLNMLHLHSHTYKQYGYITILSPALFFFTSRFFCESWRILVLTLLSVYFSTSNYHNLKCVFSVLSFVGIVLFFLCGLLQNFSHRIKSTLCVWQVVCMTVEKTKPVKVKQKTRFTNTYIFYLNFIGMSLYPSLFYGFFF